VDGQGRCTEARITLFGVGDRPMLAAAGARALQGEAPTPEAIRAAADATAREDIDPTSDIHASSVYRRHLAGVLTRRVLERAFERARANT
jgi:carbon-monoxide dehydrogenase medium subunit